MSGLFGVRAAALLGSGVAWGGLRAKDCLRLVFDFSSSELFQVNITLEAPQREGSKLPFCQC